MVVWLGTSARGEELDLYLKALDASDKIAGFTAAEDIDDGKPAPSLFAAALTGIDRPPEEVLTVGDTVWDIIEAAAAAISPPLPY